MMGWAMIGALSGCERSAPQTSPGAAAMSGTGTATATATATAETSTPTGTTITTGAASPTPAGWQNVMTDALCVTSGSIAPRGMSRFGIDAPTFRCVTSKAADPKAQLRFTYLGPTATTRALGSGAVRQQLGLKLRAQDPCNLVYVMWRFEPEQKLVVSIKQNAGQRTSAECGNRGYKNIKPRTTGPLPPIAQNATHVLRAEMDGDALRVFVDDASVWEGSLGPEALALSGPIGVRSDNVRVEAELAGTGAGAARVCGQGDEGE